MEKRTDQRFADVTSRFEQNDQRNQDQLNKSAERHRDLQDKITLINENILEMKIKDDKQQDFLIDLEDRLNTLYESTEK